ncbi:hypothetical protein PENANT_c009G04591 [Penicillium antarcticum]|uniref:Major facilitator superfamily transporter n=1 Tax=Penicillium antarcticum TaxID=416450 RepID=A0A1V6QA79_9EURO|nr:uncharacterized protein N7508_006313 [Penicillium antarcticum]KAJ5301450.1 hypothetical protein N7508_006313 [Penicillium antarcticum]OQD85907.1 hypothetical protein PENANT_c009G04591 [Penicillium antarcticum]
MTVQARRHSAAYKSPSPYSARQDTDIEKQPTLVRHTYHHHPSDDSDDESLDDDSNVADSYPPPVLTGAGLRRAQAGVGFRVPQRIMRWLCLALFGALVLFILTLFRFTLSGSVSQVTVELPKVVAAKPPQWESFPFLSRYVGGISTLVSRKDNVPEYPGDGSEELVLRTDLSDEQTEDDNNKVNKRDLSPNMQSSVFNPYPDYQSPDYLQKYGEKRECFLDKENTLRVPSVQSYPGVPKGFPVPVMGSNTMLGIRDDMCFDRFGRLGPYGFGYGAKKGGSGAGLEGHRDGAERVWEDIPPVDFRPVDWAGAQNRCHAANRHRFNALPEPRLERFVSMPMGVPKVNIPELEEDSREEPPKVGAEKLPRTAVVIRTWHDFDYSAEDIMYLRSVISELSLNSGGEYTVHFLVHVKDTNLQIWSDDETYQRVLRDSLPEEFRGLGTLWTEPQMALMYPGLEETNMRGLPIHGVYRSTYMPMQYFAFQHPEYDYFWNWEMDARYTGHWYHLFDKVGDWAKKQPRKGLWERNARFYVPSVHGSWEDFRQMVRVQTEIGTNSKNNMWSAMKEGNDKGSPLHQSGDRSIWGPERPDERDIFEVEGEGIPPTSMDKDQYQWGVGEDADLVVFNPLYDPEGTTWILRDDVTGYNREKGMPPRRTAIITASRISRKLLTTMHRECSLKRHSMFSEMWPATTALHHGFKAVFVPHAVYVDRRWPTRYLESVFNAGRNGASGGARTSIFGDREHNFRGTTWFYSAGFSPNLWRRWLGLRVDNDGGEQQELAGEGRMCLPPMLLHPVKQVNMIIDDGEHAEDR